MKPCVPNPRARKLLHLRVNRRNSGARLVDTTGMAPKSPCDEEPSAQVDTFGRARTEPAPYHGRNVLICSPLREDRFLLTEYAIELGWGVSLRLEARHAMASIETAVVLVVLRAADAISGAQVVGRLRRAHYSRHIAYLAATEAPEECDEALARGATVASPHRGDLSLMQFFSATLDDSLSKYPARLRFEPFELDLEDKRVWVFENDDLVEKVVTPNLFAALELLVRRNGQDAHITELCEVSGTSTHGSAPRELISRLRAALGPLASDAVSNRTAGYYGLKHQR